jgi:hypothetical protein
MEQRCCRKCLYAMQLKGRWLRVIMSRYPGLMICFNCAKAPGTMQEVYVGGLCRNFQPRPELPSSLAMRQPKDGKSRVIPLTKGKVAIVDAADYAWLSQYKWSAYERRGKFYACRRKGRRTIWMHREIVNAPKGLVVDHKDGNSLNNRAGNLRICTPRQNGYNVRRRNWALDWASRFVGVFPHRDKWYAKIGHEGREYLMGPFDTDIEAAKAYDQKAFALQGEYAYLNFPYEDYDELPSAL